MSRVTDQRRDLEACFRDVFVTCIAVDGNLGNSIDSYAQACLSRETHITRQYIKVKEDLNEPLQDYYAAGIPSIVSDIHEERITSMVQRSQDTIADVLGPIPPAITIITSQIGGDTRYTKSLIETVWGCGRNHLSMSCPKVIVPGSSVLQSLLECLQAFVDHDCDEMIIGAIDSLISREQLCEYLMSKNLMTEDNLDKNALGEAAVWLKFTKQKHTSCSRLKLISEFYCTDNSSLQRMRCYFQKRLQKLLLNVDMTDLEVESLLCQGSYDLDSMQELRMLQQTLSFLSGVKPILATVNLICGNVGAASLLLQIAVSHRLCVQSCHQKAHVVWAAGARDARGVVIIT